MAQRLDVYLVENSLVSSRERAKAVIMAGDVYIDNQKADKPGTPVKEGMKVEVRADDMKYVSRGGLKLEKAMERFSLKLDNMICADIGASTGGFTDCMLQNGAKKVYAIDVGYGQLAWSLRTDERVVNMERTNFRYVTHEQIAEDLDFASVDVSFISLEKILPVMQKLMNDNSTAVCLIKPQFEAGREKVGKKGVVRDKNVHIEVVEKILKFAQSLGFSVKGLDFSPIKGPQGNIEYLMYIKNDAKGEMRLEISPKELVENSHETLDK